MGVGPTAEELLKVWLAPRTHPTVPTRLILGRLARVFPDLKVKSPYLLLPVRDGLTSGFCFDRPRSGIYLTILSLPLTDDPEFGSLTYGERLTHEEGGFVLARNRTLDELVDDIALKFRNRWEEVLARYDWADFVQRHARLAHTTNTTIRFSFATALAKTGDLEGAKNAMAGVVEDPWLQQQTDRWANAKRFKEALEDGDASVALLLSDWEQRAQARLGLA